MLVQTQGVVLKQIKYGESSVILKVFTREMGVLSFMVKGVRKAKSKQKSALFLPLSLLNLEVNYQKTKKIHFLKDVHIALPYFDVYTNIQKSTVCIFLAEIMSYSLNEEEKDGRMFDYIYESLQFYDRKSEQYADFHLFFLLRLSQFLGFCPSCGAGIYFDLREACFVSESPEHQDYLAKEECTSFAHLLQRLENNHTDAFLPLSQRKVLLKKIVLLYKIHLHDLNEIKSLQILEEVFS